MREATQRRGSRIRKTIGRVAQRGQQRERVADLERHLLDDERAAGAATAQLPHRLGRRQQLGGALDRRRSYHVASNGSWL